MEMGRMEEREGGHFWSGLVRFGQVLSKRGWWWGWGRDVRNGIDFIKAKEQWQRVSDWIRWRFRGRNH